MGEILGPDCFQEEGNAFLTQKGMYRPSVKNFPVFSSNGSNLQSNHNKFAHHQNVNPNQNGVTET